LSDAKKSFKNFGLQETIHTMIL